MGIFEDDLDLIKLLRKSQSLSREGVLKPDWMKNFFSR
jgi:hypothetical protein